MFENLSERFNQSREVFAAMPPARKVLLASVVAAAIASFVVLLLWTNKTEYDVLFGGLTQEDAGAIVEQLDKKKIPYRLTQNGSVVEVPQEVVQETRLFLATQGLPAGGSIGMEMFNETRLGETDFLQHLNYQRALQGELERTIMKFPAVLQARIHLNIPKETLFIEEERPPTASVVLSLKRGRELSTAQIKGIVHLVASSVEGLDDKNISVVDTSGGLLYSKDDGAETGMMTATQLEQRRAMEKRLGDRITSMLERIVGPQKALSRVTAELTFNRISTSEEVYDPDRTAIRSEQRLSEKNLGPAKGAEGIPQSSFELGTGNEQQDEAGPRGEVYERNEETTNYEITKINRQIITPAGDVKRLSVAVLVDGIYEEVVKDGETSQTYIPRPQTELDKLSELVKSAVGYDETRGDAVVVQSVPFYLEKRPTPGWWAMPMDYVSQYGRTALNILLIVLFFLFIVRPILAWLRREVAPEAPATEPAALLEGEGEAAEMLPGKMEKGQLTRDQVLQLAQQDPERTVNLIRAWIDES